jgi:hypothetical protein
MLWSWLRRWFRGDTEVLTPAESPCVREEGMLCFETELVCPMCSYRFRVCVHAKQAPDPEQVFHVACPMNASVLPVRGKDLRAVKRCTRGAVEPRENDGNLLAPSGESRLP